MKFLKKLLKITTTICPLALSPFAYAVENPLFHYTHLLPSPFTLPAGKVMLGTTSAVGITNFLELQTDVVSDVFQIYNAKARLSLLDFPGFAAGAYLGFQYFNPNTFSVANPSIGVTSWMPGLVTSFEILPYFALFLGGNLYYSSPALATGIETSGFLQGGQVESDVSWAYNPHEGKTGNVLSAGFTYNTTFSFYGVGISHHWPGFHVGIHYYPNVNTNKILPIISGGMAVEI